MPCAAGGETEAGRSGTPCPASHSWSVTAKTQTPGNPARTLGPMPLGDAAGSLRPHCALKAVSTQPTVWLRPWGPSWVLRAAVCLPFTPRRCRLAVSELELLISVWSLQRPGAGRGGPRARRRADPGWLGDTFISTDGLPAPHSTSTPVPVVLGARPMVLWAEA